MIDFKKRLHGDESLREVYALLLRLWRHRFSSSKTEDVETEVRILLACLKKRQYLYQVDADHKIGVMGKLLEFLPKITNNELRKEAEEILKNKSEQTEQN